MNATEALKHEIAGAVFMHKLQAWIRDNHEIVTLKQADTVPEYDLRLTVPTRGQGAEDFFKEHLPFLLTLLPKSVAVVDRAALESYVGVLMPDPGGLKDPLVGKYLIQALEGNASIMVMQQAHAALEKRKGIRPE